jgi:hypothetical protein
MASASDSAIPLTPPAMTVYRPVLLRPNQPGAPHFDGKNVTEFIEEWGFFCDDYGCNDRLKCTRLPSYCDKKISDDIKRLNGFAAEDWATFSSSIIGLYWQHDKPKNTMTELNQLIQNSSTLDLNIYLLHYASITEVLVAENALSPLDRVNRLLDGLPGELRKRVLKFCTKKAWKLSAQDTGTVEPVFEELKKFLVEEAQARQKETVYDKERKAREGLSDPTELDSSLSSQISTVKSETDPPQVTPSVTPSLTTAKPAPVSDSVAELTRQFSELALMVRANMSPASKSTESSSASNYVPQRRPNVCHWCDEPAHMRNNCSDYLKSEREGKIRINENNRVVDVATGMEFPLMIGKGGMRRILEMRTGASAPALIPTQVKRVQPVNVGNIMLEPTPSYSSVGGGSVIVSTIDFENDTQFDEIVDVDVFEKRRRGGLDDGPQASKRPKPSDGPTPSRQPYVEDVADEGELPVRPFVSRIPPASAAPIPSPVPLPQFQSHGPIPFPPAPAVESQPSAPVGEDHIKKFRLASKLSKEITVADVGEKVMESDVTLKFRELLAVSPGVTGFVYDQSRRQRLPVDSIPHGVISANASATYFDPSTSAASVHLYACPSSRAKATLDGTLRTWGLIDHGSEVNLIPRRIFDRMDNIPVDTDIEWTINAYHQSGKAPPNGMIGVIHALSVDVGNVEVKIPVFVVEEAFQDLILGRPWERAVRAIITNNNDGSTTVQIHSEDGRRAVRFTGVTGEHERNREFAKRAVNPLVSIDPLKV